MKPRKDTSAQWTRKHADASLAADTARIERDCHPAMSPRWIRANDAMLRAQTLASYATRKIYENDVRNGRGLPHDVLVLYPDLGTPDWQPATTTAWGLYNQSYTPPAPPVPAPDPITPHSITSVPRTTRDSKQTCEHLFTYWTRRIAHATNMRDRAREANCAMKVISKWQRVIDKAHAKRRAYIPARNHADQPARAKQPLTHDSRSQDQ